MYIADLHIHSKYSRATSKDLEPEQLDFWARRKGIGLVGTGDFTHPAWRAELKDKLTPAEEGFYTLKGASGGPRFVITGEISTIYKKDGRVRKVHSVILLPHLEAAESLSRRLEAIGNLHSDGRPILGLDCRDLLEITLESCPDAVFIPAHIWTPHFSLFGAFSGFDTIEECFGDLTGHIHALETGLSSDPPMNHRCSALDGYTLVSNSDAHSPSKLGREANLLDTGLSYPELSRAIQTGESFHGTIEFFPEEGKYHFDGHRNCSVCLSPVEAEAAGGVCPVCGKRLTTGVLHRVEQLADRPEGFVPEEARPFESLVPLPEVIAASEGGSAAGKKVGARYEAMLAQLGPEFTILREVPLEDIRHAAGPLVAEGIRRLRAGQVVRKPGYDGAYGVIELLSPAEREDMRGQVSFFGAEAPRQGKAAGGRVAKPAKGRRAVTAAPAGGLNEAQRAAVTAVGPTVAVLAGPGTGKTHTLVERAAWLVEEQKAKPAEITAITFTNRAAEELRRRLEERLGKRAARAMTIGTFHAVCLELLGDVPLADPYQQRAAASAALEALGRKGSPAALLRAVSRWKTGMDTQEDPAFARYQEGLGGRLDFDDLLREALNQWRAGRTDRRFTHLLVDEFQDVDRLQLALLLAWRREGGTLFAIGDPDQSIYGFRGADPACFAALEGADTITLRENYRSTPEILAAALPVAEAVDGAKRPLEAVRPHGPAARLVTAPGDRAEAIFIAKEIARMVGGMGMVEAQALGAARGARSFGDIAVLCRTRRQLALLEECLAHDGIPCVVAGREDFLLDDEVRAALAWLEEQEDGTPPAALLERWAAHHTPSGGVERLRSMAVFFGSTAAFLRNLTIGQEGDILRRVGMSYAAGSVTLSTLHAAKGLEWPVVFLCGAGEGRIPLEGPGIEADQAGERRLLYVGMTRARDELVLTTGGTPSRFLEGLPLQKEEARPASPRPQGVQMSLF